MNETPLCETLIGMTTPEAVGTILREGFDFRIVKEDNREIWRGGNPDEKRINLEIFDRRVTAATVG